MTEIPGRHDESRGHYDKLAAQLAANRADIDALQVRADEASVRADALDDAAEAQRLRIDNLEANGEVDRQLIAELQADGVLNQEYSANLERALVSSRRIGAAMGIIMAIVKVREDAAFELLRRASQRTNRKVREIADDIISSGDLTPLGLGRRGGASG